ncbi:hypothetical protein AMTRI_Chr03g145480 [Amborella trichopoda]
MAPLFWFTIGEYVEVSKAVLASNSSFWVGSRASFAVGLSCISGLAISLFGFVAWKAVSTTAFTVTGVFVTVAINVLVWDQHANPFQSVTKALPSHLGSTRVKQSVGMDGDSLSTDQGKGQLGKFSLFYGARMIFGLENFRYLRKVVLKIRKF